MPISIKSASTTVNMPVTFNFDAPVANSVVGLAYWSFEFAGSDDHHVKSIELTVTPSKPSLSQVSATAHAILRDASGASIDNTKSRVTLVCVAETVQDDGNIAMANVEGIASGSQSGSVPLPGGNGAAGLAFLKGFGLGYVGDDHHMKLLELAAGFVPSGSTGSISALARMSDGSGHGCTGTISGGLVASNFTHRGLLTFQTRPLQRVGSEEIDLGVSLKEAGAIIQSLRLSFSGDDHHIDTIGGGCSKCVVSGTRVVLTDPRAFMRDDSGHNQDNDVPDSHVVLAVFAVPV